MLYNILYSYKIFCNIAIIFIVIIICYYYMHKMYFILNIFKSHPFLSNYSIKNCVLKLNSPFAI